MPIDRPNVFGQGAATNTDLYADAARGLLGEKVRLYTLYGYNEDVDTAFEPIAPDGQRRNVITGTAIGRINSLSAADASGGLGANVMHIEGIDDNGNAASEDVTLNGTSNVVLANTYSFVNSCVVKTAGALSTNAAVIRLVDASGGIVGNIPAATGAYPAGGIAYPKNHKAIVKDISVNVSRNPAVPFGNAHLNLQLVHAQDITTSGNPITNVIWQRKITFTTSSSNVNVYNIENEIVNPPFFKGKSSTLTEAGALYFQASSTGTNQHVYLAANVLVTKL